MFSSWNILLSARESCYVNLTHSQTMHHNSCLKGIFFFLLRFTCSSVFLMVLTSFKLYNISPLTLQNYYFNQIFLGYESNSSSVQLQNKVYYTKTLQAVLFQFITIIVINIQLYYESSYNLGCAFTLSKLYTTGFTGYAFILAGL